MIKYQEVRSNDFSRLEQGQYSFVVTTSHSVIRVGSFVVTILVVPLPVGASLRSRKHFEGL